MPESVCLSTILENAPGRSLSPSSNSSWCICFTDPCGSCRKPSADNARYGAALPSSPQLRGEADAAQRSAVISHARVALGKFWLRRRAHRVKPATDVDLGMSFTAVMSGSSGVGGFRIPPVQGQIGISASNHEPVDGIGSNESTDFTPEFLHRCHVLDSSGTCIGTRKLLARR